jgi:Ca2+:H+ antiporter
MHEGSTGEIMKAAELTAHRMPWWAWAAPLGAMGLLIGRFSYAIDPGTLLFLSLAAACLGGSVFASVYHAEVVAHRVGEPLGSIILAAAVTAIEVSLIISIMLTSPGGGHEVARDTVFAAMMIVLNGVVGLCLLFGGLRHHEQGFQPQAAAATLGVLATLATLALILPDYTLTIPGPAYSPVQLAFVAFVSLALYGLFLFVQAVRHRNHFIDINSEPSSHAPPSGKAVALSGVLLVISLAGVILIAETLSPAVERATAAAGLPGEFVGLLIAALVLLPEGTSALRAAFANRLQKSLNLALGSALASIGLSIPTIALVSLFLEHPLVLGLTHEHIVLLVLTLFISTLTLATGRTTVLQGGVHLVIFGSFVVMSVVP